LIETHPCIAFLESIVEGRHGGRPEIDAPDGNDMGSLQGQILPFFKEMVETNFTQKT
jgi:hypothetical protein